MPLSKRLGIVKSNLPDYLLLLQFDPANLNHVHTIHASVIYSLAEISSGYFLKKHFPGYAEKTVPILRKSTIKYKKLCTGDLYSKVIPTYQNKETVIQTLQQNKKVSVKLNVQLFNAQHQQVVQADFEWFISLP